MEFFSSKAAAEYLGIGQATLWRRMKAGKIAYHQDIPGGHRKFTRTDLDKYIEDSRKAPKNAKPFTGETYRNRRV